MWKIWFLEVILCLGIYFEEIVMIYFNVGLEMLVIELVFWDV